MPTNIPRFPDATTGAAAGRTLRSQPDPSPNTPRDQIRRKGPCCDITHEGRTAAGLLVVCCVLGSALLLCTVIEENERKAIPTEDVNVACNIGFPRARLATTYHASVDSTKPPLFFDYTWSATHLCTGEHISLKTMIRTFTCNQRPSPSNSRNRMHTRQTERST